MENNVELAIVLERIRLVDSFFHVSPPRNNKLQSSLKVDLPRWHYDTGDESKHPQLNCMINVSFMLSDGPAPEQITPENSDKVAMTFGCLVDVSVGSPAMGEAITAGKHESIENNDLDAHRSKRMERSLIREALEAAYAFASTRLIEASSLSPMGLITMPLPDYEAIMETIDERRGV